MTDAVAAAKDDIAKTREQLAQTTALLAAKTDVKARVTVAAKANQQRLSVLAGATALLIAALAWKGQRAKRTPA